ncbi:MAG: hypothetical protein FH751_13255 [Firmicutes bacterium]|nr:hypothetical protein [Bacillota bacterium]
MENDRELRNKKLLKCSYITIIIFTCLIGALFYRQVIKGKYYKQEAIKQRTTSIRVYPPRGTILDRNSIPLTNRDREEVLFVSKNILNNSEIKNNIKEICNLNDKELDDIINHSDRVIELPIVKDIKKEIEGVIKSEKTLRYSKEKLLSHVIGYVKESENIGVSGVEKIYDNILKMDDKYGTINFQFDGKNRPLKGVATPVLKEEIGYTNSIMLTIDYHIQKIVEKALDKYKSNGAVIVTDTQSGDILAMASRPNIDPENINIKSDKLDNYNKAIHVGYPPASLFKTVVLLSALENNEIILDESFYCKGYEEIGNVKINCHSIKDGGHEKLKINEAFYDSCNSVFIQLGKRLGGKNIIKTAKKLGFGSNVDIELAGEIKGSLPQGDELLGPSVGNISIGQGKILVTPLQITNMMMIIANDGIEKDISIFKGFVTNNGSIVKKGRREEPKKVVSKLYTDIIKDYMKEVVTKGTAKGYVSLEGIGGAAGKTGTAQAMFNGKEVKHGWFSGFYPKDNPKYVITVLVEEGNSGGRSAGPIFNDIAEEIYTIGK